MIEIDVSLVRRLIAGQFPHWSDLPVRPVERSGWDNRTFHLGEQMSVRLPSAARYVPQVEKEHRWLPELALLLPLPIPVPLGLGRPSEDYPWPWSVYRWLEGDTADKRDIADLNQFAVDLARFLAALHAVDASTGPLAGKHNFHRGGLLEVYDSEARQTIALLAAENDAERLTAVWEAALATTWQGKPVWVHGDVAQGNLLVKGGRLSAVIDFGSAGVGDPACDLVIAWTLFGGESRKAFKAALPLDPTTWARARGWVLWKAAITIIQHRNDNPDEAAKARHVLNEVVGDHHDAPCAGR
ncbi:MAG: aminoglycoside phosphotransferase family protein [Pseudomonadota bacterium]